MDERVVYGYPFLMESNKRYNLTKKISNLLQDLLEKFLKQFIGTYVGQRVFKWFTDFLITRMFDTAVKPLMRVAVIKLNYYFDVKDGEERIVKLKTAKESGDEELYYNTLNDIFK